MGYSNDLRVRVIRVVEGGVAARAAICDRGCDRDPLGEALAETGSFEARSVRGQSRSPLKKHEDWLLELVRQEPDLTLRRRERHGRTINPSSIPTG